MADHIRIREAGGTWSVRAGGAILGETKGALELTEGSDAPLIYFPRGDIAMAFLEASDTRTHCPHKGDASHYSIVTKSTVLTDRAWSYEDPLPGLEAIKGYLAFYTSDQVTVEEI